MKKTLTLLLTVVLIMALSIPVLADNVTTGKTYGELLFDLGIIVGSNGDIKEADYITREQMVSILVRLIEGDYEFTPPTTPTFKDVPTTHWAYKDIELAYSKGITSGTGNGMFGLGSKINNNQAALFLIRSLGYDTSHSDYNSASSIIAKEFGLTLDQTVIGSKELIRGQVFELLAKTLNMPTKDNPNLKKVDLLKYDSNAVEKFKSAIEKAVPYKLEEQKADTKPQTNVSEFPVKVICVDKGAYLEYLKKYPSYTNVLDEMEEQRDNMISYINKYLKTDYKVLNITDELIEKINFYSPRFIDIDLFEYEEEFYEIYSWISLDLSRDGDKVIMNTLAESTEGYGGSTGYITEIREYNYGKGLKVYVVLGQEQDFRETADGTFERVYVDFYVSFVVDSQGNLVEIIGNTTYGSGYYKYE